MRIEPLQVSLKVLGGVMRYRLTRDGETIALTNRKCDAVELMKAKQ